MSRRLVLFLLCIASISAFAENKFQQTLLDNAGSHYIIPAHNAMVHAVNDLGKSAAVYCKDSSKQDFLSLQLGWQAAMKHWSRLAIITFGPLDDSNLGWRFQFWPDPINLVHRKFRSRIKGINKKIDADSLAKASVAIQGLSAIEYLLFDEQVGGVAAFEKKSHLCQILIHTIDNLANNAQRLSLAWKKHNQLWQDPIKEKSHPGFLKRNVEHLLSGVVMALGTIKNDKLGKALSIKKDELIADKERSHYQRALNPWMLESWRSQTSLQNIKHTLEFGFELYRTENGLRDYLKQQGSHSHLDKEITALFELAIKQLQSPEDNAFVMLQNGQPETLLALHYTISSLYKVLKVDYTQAANIQFRFNAKDGD